LGIGYLAAWLEKSGHEVQIIEGAFYESDEEIIEMVRDFGARMFGVSVIINNFTAALTLTRLAKETLEGVTTVVGGPHPSAVPRQFVDNHYVDFVLTGEGEQPLMMLANLLQGGGSRYGDVPGVWWKGGKSNLDSERMVALDESPWPARHLMEMNKYRHRDYVISLGMHGTNFNIITARGCPGKCNFCDHSVFGRRAIHRSIKNVVDEIQWVSTQYGIRNFDVMDDTFTYNRKRVLELCRELIRRDLNLFWCCRLRADTVTEEMIALMAEAGCIRFSMGIESVEERVRLAINKGNSMDQVNNALIWGKKYGMLTVGNFMIGNLGDDRASVMRSLNYSLENENIDVPSFTVLTPLPGTPVFDIASEKGWIRSFNWDDYRMNTKDLPVMRNEALDFEELRDLYSEVAAAVRPKIEHAMAHKHAPRRALYPELPQT